MLLNWKEMEAKDTPNFVGGEGVLKIKSFIDEHVRIFMITLPPGGSIGPHIHDQNLEVAYLIDGELTAIGEDGVVEVLTPGVASYCPKGKGHTAINKSDKDATVLAIIPVKIPD